MSPMLSTGLLPWLCALVVSWAVATLVLTRPSPRRFPEDDAGLVRGGAGPTPSATVPTRAAPVRPLARVPVWRRRRGGAVAGTTARGTGRGSPDRSGDDLTDLATCCDLLAVAVASGSPVGRAITSVGSVGHGPVARALGRASESMRRGSTVADAIDSIGVDLGPGGQALSTTLATAVSSGAPPASALLRLADAERRRTRRRVEARVRRLPVLLLLPLVGLILPAFVLLTLVPVGLSVARSADVVGMPATHHPDGTARPHTAPSP